MDVINKIMDFQVTIGTEPRDKERLVSDLQIDRSRLQDEFLRQPGLFFEYGSLAVAAEFRRQHLKHELEVESARIDYEKRLEAKSSIGFKYTEKMHENELKLDVRYQQKYQDYLEATRVAGILKVGHEAFEQRKDMLISLGADRRQLDGPERLLDKQEQVKSYLASKNK